MTPIVVPPPRTPPFAVAADASAANAATATPANAIQPRAAAKAGYAGFAIAETFETTPSAAFVSKSVAARNPVNMKTHVFAMLRG